ncbi:MAG: NHLP bacteriocin export ABC transporter permease/ATPase subunit [Planctomycetes bacterium]|nr:NHLP bacteriocin export ABC transporter permease/ATPase subunit [Planctomycetota bacterium]
MTTSGSEISIGQGMYFTPPPAGQAVYTVLSGRVEVYACTPPERPVYHKEFLAELSPGQSWLLPSEDDGTGYEILGLEDSQVRRKDGTALPDEEYLREAESWFAAVAKLEWLQYHQAMGDETVRRWAKPGAFPIEAGSIREGVASDRRRLATLLDDRFTSLDRRDRDRLFTHSHRREKVMSGALAQLSAGQSPEGPVTGVLAETADPVQFAVRALASYFGGETARVRLPDQLAAKMDSLTLLRKLSAKAGISLRLVALEKGWHRSDAGAMVGYYGENGDVCALIPRDTQTYHLYSLEHPQGLVVTDDIAKDIRRDAFVCYNGLPATRLSTVAMLRTMLTRTWKSDWRALLLVSVIAGLLPLVLPLITESIFQDIIPIADRRALGTVTQVMLISGFVTVILTFVRDLACTRIKRHLGTGLETAMWARLLNLPARFFRHYKVGDLASRMAGMTMVTEVFNSTFISAFFGAVFSFWSVFLMFHYSASLAFYTLCVWVVYLAVIAFVYRNTLHAQRMKTEAANRNSALVVQLLNGLSTFKLKGGEEQAFFLWSRTFSGEWKWNLSLRRQQNWIQALNVLMPAVTTIIIYYAAAKLAMPDPEAGRLFPELTIPQFLGFQTVFAGLNATIMQFIPLVSQFYSVKPLLENIEPVLKELPETSDDKADADPLSGAISVRNVSFSYEAESPMVLRDVSLEIRPGESVALVGTSGCGKSTLLRLLLGFETPVKGAIHYDSQDLATLNAASVRAQMGVVLQNGVLMSGDILTNILGASTLTIEDAWEAARMVGLDKDIQNMPMGMYTMVSEGGGNISGGQKQRILIARSLVNRPRIVIMDEATSALDNITQQVVSESVAKLNATRIIVAHRLSTIIDVDRIYVMDAGRIVEEGSFTELMAKDGLFARLAKRQLS